MITKLRTVLTSKEAIIAVVSSVLTLAGALVVTEWSRRKVDNRLAIVDVAFAKGTGRAEALDVKVRNAGDLVASISHARLDVRRQWSLRPQWMFTAGMGNSGEYEIVLPVMRAPVSVTVPISQAVQTNEPDQFRLNINSFGRIEMEHQLFLVTVTLLYNEARLEATSEPIVIAMGPNVRLSEMYVQDVTLGGPSGAIGGFSHPNEPNVKLAKEIAALDVKKSPFATAVVDAVLQSEKKTH